MRSPARLVATALVLLVSLVGSSGSASPSSGPDPEVQTHEYVYSHGVYTWHWDVSLHEQLPPITFTPRRFDEQVHLRVEDALGQGVVVHVFQEGGRGERDLVQEFCSRAIAYDLVSDEPVELLIYSGACRNHNFGFATTGTITATFSTL